MISKSISSNSPYFQALKGQMGVPSLFHEPKKGHQLQQWTSSLIFWWCMGPAHQWVIFSLFPLISLAHLVSKAPGRWINVRQSSGGGVGVWEGPHHDNHVREGVGLSWWHEEVGGRDVVAAQREGKRPTSLLKMGVVRRGQPVPEYGPYWRCSCEANNTESL